MIVWSLVLGILSIIFSIISWAAIWWFSLISLILGILGIVFSVIGKNRYGDWNGVSIGGLVTSIVGLVITGAQLIFVIYALGIAARIVVS